MFQYCKLTSAISCYQKVTQCWINTYVLFLNPHCRVISIHSSQLTAIVFSLTTLGRSMQLGLCVHTTRRYSRCEHTSYCEMLPDCAISFLIPLRCMKLLRYLPTLSEYRCLTYIVDDRALSVGGCLCLPHECRRLCIAIAARFSNTWYRLISLLRTVWVTRNAFSLKVGWV
jgi:hypothetical protein